MTPPLVRIAVAVAAAIFIGLTTPATSLATPTLHGVVQAGTSTSESAITINTPPGNLGGDVLIAVVDARLPGSAAITAQSGWYLLRKEGTTGTEPSPDSLHRPSQSRGVRLFELHDGKNEKRRIEFF